MANEFDEYSKWSEFLWESMKEKLRFLLIDRSSTRWRKWTFRLRKQSAAKIDVSTRAEPKTKKTSFRLFSSRLKLRDECCFLSLRLVFHWVFSLWWSMSFVKKNFVFCFSLSRRKMSEIKKNISNQIISEFLSRSVLRDRSINHWNNSSTNQAAFLNVKHFLDEFFFEPRIDVRTNFFCTKNHE